MNTRSASSITTPELSYHDSDGIRRTVAEPETTNVTATMLAPGQTEEGGTLLGLEAEMIVADARTLVAQDARVLLDMKLDGAAELHPELNIEIVELAFSRGLDYDTLRESIVRSMGALRERLSASGQELLMTSVYPFGKLTVDTENPYIAMLTERYGAAVSENVGFIGVQLHKEFRDLGVGIELYNQLRTVLHYLTVFTLNSPLTNDGRYRGMASERIGAKKLNVLGGIPPRITGSPEEYVQDYQRKLDLGLYEGPSATNYDVRPPRLHTNTIEINVIDICQNTRHWFALLDLYDQICQAIALHHREGKRLPETLFNPDLDADSLAYNRHAVAMSGTESAIVEGTGRRKTPLKEQIEALLRFLEDDAGLRFQDHRTSSVLHDVLDQGSPAERQVQQYARRTGRTRREIVGTTIDPALIREVLAEEISTAAATLDADIR